MNQQIREITPEETYGIRHQVLWPEKPLDYVKIENDAEGKHYGLFVDEKLVSIISLFFNKTDHTARFRKFATLPDFQAKGLGTKLLMLCIEKATEKSCEAIWCDARTDALGFYECFGFERAPEPFYKGSIEYYKISRKLK